MQSMSKAAAADSKRPAKLTIMSTLSYIYRENGIKGLYRGVTPRIGLGVWQTICMVSLTDYVKLWYVPSLIVAYLRPNNASVGLREHLSRQCF